MRGRPQITVEEIFRLFERWEQDYPVGSSGRGERLERIAAYILSHLEHVMIMRRLPSRRDLAELRKQTALVGRLLDMVETRDRTGERRPRALARLVLGKSSGDMSADVLRLAREYGAFLAEAGVVINGGSGPDA